MVFQKLVEIVSAAASRLSSSKSSSAPYLSTGLPPLPGSANGSRYASSGQKGTLRLSSSLQDLSAYSRPRQEGNHLDLEADSAHAGQLKLLQNVNAGSSFSKERASPRVHSLKKRWMQIMLLLLCLSLFAILLFAIPLLYSNWSLGSSKFFVVLDCGSTGTRVYIYEASVDHKKENSLPFSLRSLPQSFHRKSSSQSGRAYNRMETEPGFDKLVQNITGLRGALKPLIQWAEKQIPGTAYETTSVYLYATAGLRRLPSSDSDWLLENAWSILKDSPFLCKREWVKIISGMEEAYFGWIALNYHTEILGAKPKKQTYGALDLGGSSLQVTFETKEILQDETSLKLSIGPVSHDLSAYSLSGYGLNDAFDKSVVHLLKRLPNMSNSELLHQNLEIKHPCLHSGYREQYMCSLCSSLAQESESPSVGAKVVGKGSKPGIPFQLIGAPNWEECNGLAKVAVNLSEWEDQSHGIDCELQPCALKENLPRPYGQFYAMSGFYVVYKFFNLSSDASLEDVLEKGREFCEKNWDVARKSVAPQPFIEQYCFRAPYIVYLLREGLHITDSHLIIGSGSITWTLGVALLEAGKSIPAGIKMHSYEMFWMKINPVIFFSILFISLLFLLCALSCVVSWGPKYFRRPYLPLFRHNSASAASIINIPAPFRFQRWSPITIGDGRVKMPLSPTVAGTQQRSFDPGNGFPGSGIELSDSSYTSSNSVPHSYSWSSLGQMQFDSSTVGSFSLHRSQMHLQSRRSQSREDLNSSLAEAHLVKV